MDIQTIDNQYNQLQSQAQQTVGEIRALAQKLQAAAQAGDQNAREWLLDLKSITLGIQAEQNQVTNLLQSMHNFVGAQGQAMQQMPQSPWGGQPGYPQPAYPQQPMPYGYGQPQAGGVFGELLNSGFGRAIVTGAGFGIGEDIVDKIF
ncbi:MAG: hypothetical protein PHU07_10650 [Acidocella sp.]|nr:hypothetical protein [Acidocella sp.]